MYPELHIPEEFREFIPEGVAEASPVFLGDIHNVPK
jgi:hypothetical protein